jgi:hypothetical protein
LADNRHLDENTGCFVLNRVFGWDSAKEGATRPKQKTPACQGQIGCVRGKEALFATAPLW